jgi:hypothetical protein
MAKSGPDENRLSYPGASSVRQRRPPLAGPSSPPVRQTPHGDRQTRGYPAPIVQIFRSIRECPVYVNAEYIGSRAEFFLQMTEALDGLQRQSESDTLPKETGTTS